MIRKPWPIIFVSLFFFITPIVNILSTYYFLKSEYAFSDFFYSLISNSANYLALFDMVVPSLVAGIAVYSVRKWSYPVFLISMIWITIQIFTTFSTHLKFFQLFFVTLLPMIVNILYVSYILLPKVRAPYFDSRLRWWETKPRYVFSTDLKIDFNGEITEGKMTNISEGGLFSLLTSSFEPNSIVNLKFQILETEVEVSAKIVYRKSDGISHGFQFVNLSRAQKKLLKTVITKLAVGKYEVMRQPPAWNEDLVKWFKTLIKTGKGFVPETSQVPVQPPKND